MNAPAEAFRCQALAKEIAAELRPKYDLKAACLPVNVERNVQASHRLGPIFVTLAADRAIAQLALIVDIPFTLNGIEVMMSSHTRLLLRAERRQRVWRLSGFDPIYLRDEITPAIPGQTVVIDPEKLKAFRPTYRLLSYCLSSQGFPVRSDLVGIDCPDLVDALVREVYGWAGLSLPH
jgi:hypothetical protein